MAYGWHFLRPNGRLGFRDGRRVRVGRAMTMKTRPHEPDPRICYAGMHACPTITDALAVASDLAWELHGNRAWLCRVRVDADVVYGNGHSWSNCPKMAGRHRTVIYRVRWGKVEKALDKVCPDQLDGRYPTEAQYLAAMRLARR